MTEAERASPPLDQALLHAPLVPAEARAGSRWAYPPLGVALVSAFVAYHLLVLLLWVSPGAGLLKPFRLDLLERSYAVEYFSGTRNVQSWAMFAPDPTRANAFLRVLVTDQHGEVWDVGHDIWGKDRWPYVFYNRGGKVNRRIDANKHYQKVYGAWVCRQWARENGGQEPKSVQFVRRWTIVPSRNTVLEQGGWDPWAAPFQQTAQRTINCASVPDGKLPNELRERYGLEPVDDSDHLRVVFETWWTEQQETPETHE